MSNPIRVVTIDHFYRQSHSELARRHFADLLWVRAEGYGPDHHRYLLPYDMSDFIAIQHIFYIQEGSRWVPVGCMKHLPLTRADRYQIPIPIVAMAQAAGMPVHLQALQDLLDEHRRSGHELLYGGGFTIKKSARASEGLSATIRELLGALTYSDLREMNASSMICGGAIRFKTDRFLGSLGYERLRKDGADLMPFGMKHAQGDLVALMHLKKCSPLAIECHEKHRALLDSRLLLRPESEDRATEQRSAA